MGEIYRIYNENDKFTPLAWIDKLGNSRVIELSKEDADQYVNILNKESGKKTFGCRSLNETFTLLKNSGIMNKVDEAINVDMKESKLDEITKGIYEDVDKNINGFQIPFFADNNEDYEQKLKKKLEEYILQIDRPAFRKEDNLVGDVKRICKLVINAFEAAKSRKSEEAEKIVAEILEDYKKYSFAVSELDKSYAFRGIAPFDELRQKGVESQHYEDMLKGDLNFFRARVVNVREKIHKMEEINYLSYSKRSLVNDLRFSSKGKICLYLGTTSFVCSKECRWDKKDNLYLSSFIFNEKGKKLKILNLVVLESLLNGMIPRNESAPWQKDLHNSMIKVFPLVIATMFTIKTSDKDREEKYKETSKHEYLLSQILIRVLQKAGIDGVAYLSRQGQNDFQYPQMVCLAIPILDANEENQYGNLIDCYNMTNPVLFNEFSELNSDINFEKKSYINENYPKSLNVGGHEVERYNAKVICEGKEVFYQDTIFSQMDDYLVNQKHIRFTNNESEEL